MFPWSHHICALGDIAGVYDCKDKRMAQKGNHKLPTQKADAPTADPCEKLDKAACKDNKQCVWCISSAVPSSCYTVVSAAGM